MTLLPVESEMVRIRAAQGAARAEALHKASDVFQKARPANADRAAPSIYGFDFQTPAAPRLPLPVSAAEAGRVAAEASVEFFHKIKIFRYLDDSDITNACFDAVYDILSNCCTESYNFTHDLRKNQPKTVPVIFCKC